MATPTIDEHFCVEGCGGIQEWDRNQAFNPNYIDRSN